MDYNMYLYFFNYVCQDSPVYSPVDGSKWLMAKEDIQQADFGYLNIIEHLLKTHLLMEPICVLMRSTLSKFHPLYQILKWHCRELFVTNSLGLEVLLKPEMSLHTLFAIGHLGAIDLLLKAFPRITWADTEFDKNIQVIFLLDKYILFTGLEVRIGKYFPIQIDLDGK